MEVDLALVIDMQLRYKTWPLNGFNLIRVKLKSSPETQWSSQKFLEPTRETESHLHWQVPGIWQSLRRPNVELLHINPLSLRDKWHCWQSGTQNQRRDICDLQLGLDENWWANSMECYCYLRNIQDKVSHGKTTNGRRFGEPFKGPIVPFGRISPHIQESPLKNPSVWKESTPWNFPRLCCTRGVSGRET